jgi:outer membrane protein assembly factor BamB
MDRRRRVAIFGVVFVLCVSLLAVQADTTDTGPSVRAAGDGPYPGNTLISVQTYRENDGRLIEITPAGDTVWSFDPPDVRVFDGEKLDNGNVLVSYVKRLPPEECPDRFLRYESSHCIRNQVVELDGGTLNGSQDVVWHYAWLDEKLFGHEVHDADRLPNGGTAIADMGNDRAFVVNEAGEVTWEWNASEYLGANTSFRAQYGGPENPGRERDWTHLNDIDLLANGNFELSVRNFDTVLEVDRESGRIVSVLGRPGQRSLMYHQHNPYRLTRWNTTIIADSENNRVIEIDRESGEIIWSYGGRDLLRYPRDADRLPNGNTLITDTINNRVIEINPQGEVVWEYEGVRIPYSADRLSVEEERGATVPGWRLEGRTGE